MKILVAADLHYHLRKLDWIVHAAEHVDLVILAGDHLEVSSHVHRPAQAIVIQKYLQRIKQKTRLIVSSGNHDLDGRDQDGERIARWIAKLRFLNIPTDDDSVVIDDILFSIFPWSDGENADRRIREQLAEDAEKSKGKWIWVHHQPPSKSPTAWDGGNHYGASQLREWIETYQPDLVLSGHVHQSPYVPGGSWVDQIGKTWIFNAGHQMGPLPPHILIDTETPTAFWKSIPMAEVLDLEAELSRPLSPAIDAPDWVFAMDQEEAPVLE